MRYKVVFRGKFDSGINQNLMLEQLSELFDDSVENIQKTFFSGNAKEFVLISGLDVEDAQEYKTALTEIGIKVDLDLDLDFSEIQVIEKEDDQDSSTGEESEEEVTIYSQAKDIRQQFLTAQEFTLQQNDEDLNEGEVKRVERLKKIAQKRENEVEIDDRDVSSVPPLLHSGVRIGRLRFLYRIALAFAILYLCLNVLPIFLHQALGGLGYVFSFFTLFFSLAFILIIISQRFCDLDNLTLGMMVFIAAVFGIFIFSNFVNDYYSLKDLQLEFAQRFLKSNSMDSHYFELDVLLKSYVQEQSKNHIIQQVDAIVKWLVYVLMVIGCVLLFMAPGIEGNNQYGSPGDRPATMGIVVFVISLFVLIYSVSYPYSSREHRYQYRLYQIELYEYLGLLKPLPPQFNSAYKDYLRKNSTKSL